MSAFERKASGIGGGLVERKWERRSTFVQTFFSLFLTALRRLCGSGIADELPQSTIHAVQPRHAENSGQFKPEKIVEVTFENL